MSHSKRNTSRSVFTSYEREQAKKAWNTTSARLSRESFLPFSSCRLCLEPADDPVSCLHGDIFCRECALSNILAQKKEIKRLERIREQEAKESEALREHQDAEARERAIQEFEMTQNGLDVKPSSATKRKARAEETRRSVAETGVDDTPQHGTKRKFELDEEELLRIAAEDRVKARKSIDDEKASKPVLPSFWAPGVTPSSNAKDTLHEIAKKVKAVPTCPASQVDMPHTYSLQTLVTVKFTEEESERTKERQRICPSCKKLLGNASKAMLAKPCGHVICSACVDKFMRPSGHQDAYADPVDADSLRCYVCDADLVDRTPSGEGKKGEKVKKKDKEKIRPGLVELRREGTGFSAGGVNQVQKTGVAFQC